jgi:hypothetical protein
MTLHKKKVLVSTLSPIKQTSSAKTLLENDAKQ